MKKKIKNTVISSALIATTALTSSAGQTSAAVPNEPAVKQAKDQKKSKKKIKKVGKKTGPSKYRGSVKLRHPNGSKFPPQVERWANLVLAVLKELGLPRRYVNGILAQIQQESSGNPNAVNNWDINAQNGVPSKGLLQVIAPTYRAYAKKGLKNTKWQTNPYANVYAALNYVKHRYGEQKFKSWNRGQNQGY